MIKQLKYPVLALLLLAATVESASAQVIVRVRPVRPRVVAVRPVAPSPRHVWVEEDWRPQGNGYVYSGGYYAAPPRAGAGWVPGHWSGARRGYRWIPGHWR